MAQKGKKEHSDIQPEVGHIQDSLHSVQKNMNDAMEGTIQKMHDAMSSPAHFSQNPGMQINPLAPDSSHSNPAKNIGDSVNSAQETAANAISRSSQSALHLSLLNQQIADLAKQETEKNNKDSQDE